MTVADIKRYSTKSIPDLIKIATKYFNRYIRLRDTQDNYFVCISCNQPKSLDKLEAGHYLSAGHNGIVRFNEDNVHGQCHRCNFHLHGNQSNYRIGLIKKIGNERVEMLESLSRMRHKWSREGLINVIVTYKEKSKEL